jgi:hypothetical protein
MSLSSSTPPAGRRAALAAAALALLAGMGAAPAWAQSANLGDGFLCCNMRTDGKTWISDSNYLEKESVTLPAGTPLRHDGYGRQRVHVIIDGKRFTIGNDYSRTLKLDEFARRYIVAEDPRPKIAALPPAVRAAIEAFKVAPGMTREQVIMAIGYPMTSENPSLEAAEWRYWLHSFNPFVVRFDASGRVATVESDPETLARVFVR